MTCKCGKTATIERNDREVCTPCYNRLEAKAAYNRRARASTAPQRQAERAKEVAERRDSAKKRKGTVRVERALQDVPAGICPACREPVFGAGHRVKHYSKTWTICDGCEEWRQSHPRGALPTLSELRHQKRAPLPDAWRWEDDSPEWLQR